MGIATGSRARRSFVLAALFALFPPGVAPAQEKAPPPAWLTDAFVARKWVATAAERSFSLLDDGEFDLRLVERDGKPFLHLLQPGHLEGAGSYLRGGSFRAPRDVVASLSTGATGALQFQFDPSGEPIDLRGELKIQTGDFVVVRTIRRELGAAGAVAVLTCREVVVPPIGPTAAKFEVEVLALDPATSGMPRLDPAYYEQTRGATSGRVRLFSAFRFQNLLACTFDALRLDRDHLEWCGGLPRALELWEDGRISVPDGSDATLRALSDEEVRFTEQGLPLRSAMKLASDSSFAVHTNGLGFDRLLRVNVSTLKRALLEFVWRDVKADGITPKVAQAYDVFVLDPQGEPVRAAWVYARSSSTEEWPPKGLFTVSTDVDGRAHVPVRTGVDPRTVEVVAFEAGERARFGRRIGAQPSAGSGSECVVVLDHEESTRVAITPAPTFPTWIGLSIDCAALLVPVKADGTFALPALGRAATLSLGRPWLAQTTPMTLAPTAAAPLAVVAKPARGLARRVNLLNEKDGMPVKECELQEVTPEHALYVEHGSVVARGEFAGTVIRARVVAEGFEPVELSIAADAPRERDLAIKPSSGSTPK